MNHPSTISDDEFARHAGLPPGSRLREARLANGLTVTAAEVPDARWQRLVGAVNVGYLDEPDDCRGLAHLLEHALFLGSAGFPGAGELARWVGQRGGRYNARTDETVTEVHLHLPPADTDEGLARLVDMLARPRFEPGLVAHEVEVLEAEFRARLADPALHRLAALGRLCREGHPARHSHAGNRNTLGTDASRLAARLTDFHDHHYRAGLMALVMLGPLPLEAQLEQLTRHGATLPTGAVPSPPRTWRWAQPGGVAWHPPAASPGASALELFWPLPEEQAATHTDWLAAVAARLADGGLAATLQATMELDRLEVTLEPVGLGSALALSLAPTPDEETVQAMLATCCAALEQASVATLPAPSVSAADLDAWPRRYARQLPGSTERIPRGEALEESSLLPWLTPQQCRLLWQAPAASGRWKTLTETGTRWRPQPSLSEGVALPSRAPPDLCVRPRREDTDTTTPRELPRNEQFRLWCGKPARMRDTTPTSLCLGWPTPTSQLGARLCQWRQNTLPLRQAALERGLQLSCGGDARGDWLIVSGGADRLCSLAELALACWPEQATLPPCDPPTGLLAQRLLSQLETSAPRVEQAGALPMLGWVSDEQDAGAARAMLDCLAERLSAVPNLMAGTTPHEAREEIDGTRWLPPQGNDHVAMLEVAGPDDTPRNRWLLCLLAQCHDAAFQHEMRQRRGLGYVAAVRYREASGAPRLGYVVQSPHAEIDGLRQAIADFLTQQSEALACLTAAEMERRKRGLVAYAGYPETQTETIAQLWQALRRHAAMKNASPPWQPLPWEAESQALAALHADSLLDLAKDLAAGRLVQRWWLHQPR
ncbi:hypothetical protein HOP51_20550 [Halomonas sp. MCCC 1A11036]|uniref:Peptidase M16 inactive domain-containing protein n=1 Tax=Billgrantia zhangzhouensis TaxID=2733481 RepID=A0ABS9ALJ0_9GAMM|nr:insulinase family protein [Halomonas zhangzhouensis]MCE8022480.1 hypothetical protein [Halomonas zhangzhouensis]